MRDANVITAAHAVCAAGDDLSAIASNLLAGRSGLRSQVIAGREVFAGRVERWGDATSTSTTTAASAALEAAAGVLQPCNHARGARTGLIVSTTKADIDPLLAAARSDPQMQPPETGELVRLLEQLVARLAERTFLVGPTQVVSNACASGLVAMMQADRWIRRGRCERVLVVGVDRLSEFVVAGFASLAALGSGPCKPFDAARDGVSLGEAAAAVMIESPAAAGRAANPPLAAIAGYAQTSDGFHLTAPARGGVQLIAAIEQSLAMAGLAPQAIDFVNAHGTGTPYNDEAEACAIAATLPAGPPVASFKGCFGHTLGAAGVLEAAVCVELMQRQQRPASLGCQTPGVPVDLHISQAATPAPLRHVLTLKTGFGGLNAAMILSHGSDAR